VILLSANEQESGVDDKKNRKNNEQKRAKHALKMIRKLKDIDQNPASEMKKPPLYGNFRAYVENLPTTIVMNGLGQAMATELASARFGDGDILKGNCDLSELIKVLQNPAKGGRNADERAHEVLFCIVQDWLLQGSGVYSENEGLMDAIVGGNQDKYVRAQAEALAYLVWLKKFSQAFLRKGGQGERNEQ